MGINANALNESQLNRLETLLNELNDNQKIWLSGYLEGRLVNGIQAASSTSVLSVANTKIESDLKLTILFGTETGNSQELAEKLAEKAAFRQINASVFSMYDYNFEKLPEEDNLAIIVSTHGEGEPPDMADDFYKFITGNNAPSLENTSFSVLAMGDKTYKNFCKTGEDIDIALKNLGAFNSNAIMKCDVDYERDADIWMNNLLLNLTPTSVGSKPAGEPTKKQQEEYSKKNPFMATVLEKEKITGDESDKEVYHLELLLEESGITYEPGDSLGIYTKNPDSLVDAILKKTNFDPEKRVDVEDKEVTLKDALTHYLEITTITFDVLKKYLDKTKNQALEKIINTNNLLDEYLYGHDVLDLLEDFPFDWNPNKFVEILRPLPPRLYSISSSQERVAEEVHVTVSLVKYERKNRLRKGACSSHLAENIELDSKIPVYVEKNPAFKLPATNAKIIMVGAGTGIAPYRAFMQQRESKGLKGDAWLFFGDRHFKSDFLYHKEWQKLLMTNTLEKMDVAFSRDQKEKVYIQHKLLENQKEIFEWIENGAHFYLCGDMKNMAKDVNKTLLEIIQLQGGINEEQARKYLKNLKKEKRFQMDVY